MVSSTKHRKDFSDTALKDFESNTLAGIMEGFAGHGKTHTLAMITGQEPPQIRISTAIAQTPTRTITHTTVSADGVDFVPMSNKAFTDAMLASAKESIVTTTTWLKEPDR